MAKVKARRLEPAEIEALQHAYTPPQSRDELKKKRVIDRYHRENMTRIGTYYRSVGP